jgi:hypothetical protein
MTSLTLWRGKKYLESAKYAKLAVVEVYKALAGKFSQDVTHLSLVAIASMTLAAAEFKVTRDTEASVKIVEKALELIGDHQDSAVWLLLVNFLRGIQGRRVPFNQQLSASGSMIDFTPQRIDLTGPKHSFLNFDLSYNEFARHRPEIDHDLLGKDYEELLFITVFVPFISPNTPLIRPAELESAMQGRRHMLSESVQLSGRSHKKPASHILSSFLPKLNRSQGPVSLHESLIARPRLKPISLGDPQHRTAPLHTKAWSLTNGAPTLIELEPIRTQIYYKVEDARLRLKPDRNSRQFYSEPRRRE